MSRRLMAAASKRRTPAGNGWYNNLEPDVVILTADSNTTAQSKIDANPGGIIGFESGVHYERICEPTSNNQKLIGRSDGSSILDGSRDVGTTGWSGSGPWTITVDIDDRGETINTTYDTADKNGNLQPQWGTVPAQLPEDLWVRQGTTSSGIYTGAGGWRRLERTVNDTGVSYVDVATPGTGQWRLDYNSSAGSGDGVITIGDDPTGFDEIRVSVTRLAISESPNIDNILLADLTFRYYANWLRDGVVGGQPFHRGYDWQYRYITSWGNHSVGLQASPGTSMRNCLSAYNGRFGLGGDDFSQGDYANGKRLDIQDCRSHRNLLVDYNGGHGGGGCKFAIQSPDSSAATPSLIVNNWFDYNNHHGVWFDGGWNNPDVSYCEFRSNKMEHNSYRGLYIEVTHYADLLVRWNEMYSNGVGDMPGNIFSNTGNERGDGIRVNSSSNARIIENKLHDNEYGIYLNEANRHSLAMHDILVDSNEITGRSTSGNSGRVSAWRTAGTGPTSDSLNNNYYIDSASSSDFEYETTITDFAGWQAIDRGTDPPLDATGSLAVGGSVGDPPNWTPFVEKYYGAGSALDTG